MPERLERETNADLREELRKQLAVSEESIARNRAAAMDNLLRALQLADAQTPLDDLNLVRRLLAHLHFLQEDYYDAAVLGEFVGRKFPGSAGAQLCARIALLAYLKLYEAGEAEDKEFATDHIVSLATYMVNTWAGTPDAADAINTLIPFLISRGEMAKAREYVQGIPENSPQRASAELRVGESLWRDYLLGMDQVRQWERDAQEPDAAQEELQANIARRKPELEELKQNALQVLETGVARMRQAGTVDATVPRAVLALAQIYVNLDQAPQAIALLDDEKIGALAMVQRNDPVLDTPALREHAYRVALSAVVSALPKVADGAERTALIARSQQLMQALRAEVGDAPEAQQRLVEIFYSLARGLDDRGATYFTDSRTSYQGYRSLKLVTPENDQGVQLSFYPVQLRTGQTYSCSVWAKAGKEIRIEEKKSFFRKLSFKKKQPANLMQFRMSLGDASKVFDLDGEWRHYSFVVPAVSEWKLIHLNPAIELISRGTAWFDLLEVIPDIIIQSRTIPGEKGLQVELSSPREVDEIRYTLDETVPDTLSGIYTGPFMIGESCILKAAVFIDGKQDGYTESEMLVHKGTGMSLEYTNSYSSLYTGGGELALLDGKRGTTHYKDGSWQGFLKKDMEVTINLGSIMPVNKVTAGFLQDQGVWIFLPLEVTFSLSLDGSDEVKSTTISNKSAASQGSRLVMDYTASFDGIQAQFIRIKARSPGLCPPWHKGSGKPAWIFSDEVIIE